jgi:hypothetical protein
VRTTEPIAKSAATPKVGLLATFRGLLRAHHAAPRNHPLTSVPRARVGSPPSARVCVIPKPLRGAPLCLGAGDMSVGVRKRVSVGLLALSALFGGLLFAPAAALAAPPEAPVTGKTEPITATTAMFHGILNPNALAPGEAGHYEFLYRASKTECTGGSKAPEPPGTALGFEHEEAPAQEVTGLTPHTEYTVCLLARNLKGEETVGSPVTFKTAVPPETPETKPATEVTGTTATLHGVLNPNAEGDPGGFEFLYKASASECEGGESSGGSALGHKEEAVFAQVGALLPATQYTFCLRARNEAGETALGPPATFTTPAGPPTIAEESVSRVGSTEATLSAEVSPQGSPTTFRVEYGTSVAYGSFTPETSAGAGVHAASVQVQLGGLQADTPYHARVVATNGLGSIAGSDLTFTTSIAGGPAASTLPDNRAYEMVSPVANADGNVYAPDIGNNSQSVIFSDVPFRASADGNSVTYAAEPPSSGGNGNVGLGGGNEFWATRGSSGWSALDIQPPGHVSPEYQAFSTDLTVGVLRSIDQPPLAPDAPANCTVLYSRTAGDGAYHPAFTSTQTPGKCGFPMSAGISADNSHLIFESEAALTPDAEAGAGEQYNLYVSVAGQAHLVNVLPDGQPDPNASFGSPTEVESGVVVNDFGEVISSDGTRVFWTDLNTGDLYMRENPEATSARTIQVDASVGGGGYYWGASSDGAKVFFTHAGDLYEYDVGAATTSDLAPGGAVQGVVGVSDNGSHVYFVATGALADGAAPGQPNLYLRHGGVTTFIATLSPEDNTFRGPEPNAFYGDWRPRLQARTAEMTPDGQHLVFMSKQSLTGYDSISLNPNQCGANGEPRPCPEVFLYDAGAGQISCASCNPARERPVAYGSYLPYSLSNTYLLRWMSNDGSRVFFDSSEPLVPQDTNGVQDVYEWERQGAGGCQRAGGCIYLISGNLSSDFSYLVDASASGDDVFFTTRAQLVPQDRNETVDLYDARVNGGFPERSLACSGTGCQGVPPAPPTFATPASLTFNGVGNFGPSAVTAVPKPLTRAQRLAQALKACRAKHNRRKRARCVAHARKTYGAVKAHKSKRNVK